MENFALKRASDNNHDSVQDQPFYNHPYSLIRSKPVEAVGGMFKAPFVSAYKIAHFVGKLFFDVIALFGSCCNVASLNDKVRQAGLDLEGIARNTIRMIPIVGPFIGVIFDRFMYVIVSLNEIDPKTVASEGSSVSIHLVFALAQRPTNLETAISRINQLQDITISTQDFTLVIVDFFKYMADDIKAINDNAIKLGRVREGAAFVADVRERLDLIGLEDTSVLNFTVVKSLLDLDIEIIEHLLDQYKTLEIPVARERKIAFMHERKKEMLKIYNQWNDQNSLFLTVELYKIFLNDALFWRDINTSAR